MVYKVDLDPRSRTAGGFSWIAAAGRLTRLKPGPYTNPCPLILSSLGRLTENYSSLLNSHQ
jgi:hypothetical protein